MRCLFFVEVCENLYLLKGQGDRMFAELFFPANSHRMPGKAGESCDSGPVEP